MQRRFFLDMSNENNPNQSRPAEEDSVDLSSLENLQFKTAWTPSSSSEDGKFLKRSFEPRRKPFGAGKPRGDTPSDGDFPRREKPRGNFKDSRRQRFGEGGQRRGKAPQDKRSFDGGRPARKGRDGKFEKRAYVPFKFTMDVLFYPEDAAFAKLSSVMKRLKRTYQLFDIANLILEKPERFIVVAKNLPDADGKISPLYCAQPLNLPFDNEESARRFAIDRYVSELFVKESVDVEPPKGNFQVVNICSLGGEILGAPNWHRYGEFLKEFHSEKYPHVSYERFLASIESSRDADKIAGWLESMKKREVYKLKEPAEGEGESVFETREAAANYVSVKFADNLVKVYETVRMRGTNIALLPNGLIKRNMEEMLRNQRRFPIVTANNLRGRLRRSGFAIYKRGSKSYAFVSAVKRKFLFEGETFSEQPQKVFDFITANPGVSAFSLPYLFLGLEAPEIKQKAKSLAEEHNNVSQQEADAAQEPKPEGATLPEDESNGAAEGQASADAPALEQSADTAADAEVQGAELVPENASGKYSPEQLEKIKDVSRELLWLVSEGYVVEYADATLQANPYMPRPKAASKDGKAEANAAAESQNDDGAVSSDGGEAAEGVSDSMEAAAEDIPSDSESSDAVLASQEAQPAGDSYGAECNLKECLPPSVAEESKENSEGEKKE